MYVISCFMKNPPLHDSFFKLMECSISCLNRTLSHDAKTLLPQVDSFTFYRFITKTFTIITLKEYENFEKIINSDKKLSENFGVLIGTYESREPLSIINVVEKLLFSYIKENGFNFNKRDVDKLYLELENFLLSSKFKLTLEIPISGLDYVKTNDLILKKNLKIVEIQGVHSLDSNVSNDIPKHKLLFELYSSKVTEKLKNTQKQYLHQEAKHKARIVLASLRLFRSGGVGMMVGSFGNPILMSSFKIEIPDASFSDSYNQWGNFYLLPGNTEARLISLFKKLNKINFSDPKNEFLNNSLNRFMKSYTRHWEEERITDLVICLESLFLGNNTSCKAKTLSQRTSTLLEEHSTRIDLHDFIKVAYKIRSKESHGRSQNSIIVGSKQYLPSDFAKKLENHTRNAFIQFLDFQLCGKVRSNIISKLDDAWNKNSIFIP